MALYSDLPRALSHQVVRAATRFDLTLSVVVLINIAVILSVGLSMSEPK